MKLCRFQPTEFAAIDIGREMHPEPRAGVIAGGTVREISGGLFGRREETGRAWPLADVKLLPPAVPSKIVCVGRNYAEHAAEMGNALPKEPLIFLKPPSAVIAPEEPIVLPAISKRVDYEGEIALVVGRECARLPAAEPARPYILGFTCLNDVTARDLQRLDVQFTRGKGFDTFCPFGPVIETELDLGAATLETFVNGVRKQFARAAEMIFSVDAIMRWISQVMTLVPGDVIATGTPSGVGPLAPGDLVEIVVSGVGTLRNPVTGPLAP